MKQYQINSAYEALVSLAGFKLPVKTSYNIWKVAKKIEEAHSFYEQQKLKYINSHNGVISSDGRVTFNSNNDENLFIKDMNDLINLDIELDICPVVVNLDDFGNQSISITDIARLDGFVEFID